MTASSEQFTAGNMTRGKIRCLREMLICLLLTGFLLTNAEAQRPGKTPRIGYVGSVSTGSESTLAVLRQGLRDLGYVSGHNVFIEELSSDSNLGRLQEILTKLIEGKVDVIVVSSVQAALTAKQATKSIPVVFAVAQDPVGSGLVANLSRPGGNLTGVTDFARELASKRLELLKETVPRTSRVAVLSWIPGGPEYTAEKNEIESAARTLRLDLQPIEIENADDFESSFSAAVKKGANAFVALTDARLASNRIRVVETVLKHRVPAMYQDQLFVQSGGLMSYGTDRVQWRGRITYYVDKILKGAKPADLPVEQPTKFELVINLKTAKQIGVTIPANVLARADRVIR